MVSLTKRIGIPVAILTACFIVLTAGLATARPNVVQVWDIYASATGTPHDAYAVFLGPFPTAFSCAVEARLIVQNGGHAFCKDRHVLELGTRQYDLLVAEFWPSSRWIAFCNARLRGRPVSRPPQLSRTPASPDGRSHE